MPCCGNPLTPEIDGNPVNIGVAAHIAGEQGGTKSRPRRAARYNPNTSDEERNSYLNLIYLCRNCHEMIDAIPAGEIAYPVDRLRAIKCDHERKVVQAVTDAFPSVGFPELETVARGIIGCVSASTNQDFVLVYPEDKIKINELGERSRIIITMGLAISREVHRFIELASQTDESFVERLRSGFIGKYHELKGQENCRADDLFDLMCRFAQQGFDDQAERSAGLAVLIYFLESCEVFER